MKNKKIFIIWICSIIVSCIVIALIVLKISKTNISFVETNQIEYGSNITSKELVKSASGEILKYPKLDTMKIGKQKLIYQVKQVFGSSKISHEVVVKDTKFPIITLKQKEIVLNYAEDFDATKNIISVKDPIDGDLKRKDKLIAGSFCISSNVDTKKAGIYEVKISAQDVNKNIIEASYKVIVKEKNEVQPSDVQPYYVNGILLVNKKHPLPRTFGGYNAEANNALARMQAAASLEGFDLPTLSAYRSYDYQAGLYNDYVARDGKEAADRYSAQPGKSEHQTGLAFDIGQLDNNFGNTPAGKWLAQHAHEYGFIIRYPKGKEHITGYMYEPWHVRYLGVDTATSVYQSGLTLEEYLNDY